MFGCDRFECHGDPYDAECVEAEYHFFESCPLTEVDRSYPRILRCKQEVKRGARPGVEAKGTYGIGSTRYQSIQGCRNTPPPNLPSTKGLPRDTT
jgi:hypothetical protein